MLHKYMSAGTPLAIKNNETTLNKVLEYII